jgi:hypothetical protein
MKKIKIYMTLFAALVIGMTSCEIEEINDPNGPSAEAYVDGATAGDLQLLVSGLQSVQRNDMEFYFETVSIVGREYYDLNSIDPRNTGELVGASGTGLDPGGFLTTRAYAAKHRATRNAHVLEAAAANSTVEDAQKPAYIGFAQTIRAYEMLLELGRQFENGIRLETSDPQNLGPFSGGYQAGLSGIKSILDAANASLQASSEVPFVLSTGFNGFADKAGLIQFNRAIAARVALYMGDMGAASTALTESFFDLAGDMNTGVYHSFSGNSNDQFNPLFYIPGVEVDKFAVHPTFITDAEAGDTRVSSKTEPWGSTVTVDGLSGDTQITLFNANTDGFPMIRNEELILIYAEANASSPGTAVGAIDAVRAAAGLPGYTGATDPASLLIEIYHQRRYSLLGEGHRWIDMRRQGRLDELPTDRPGDIVHVQFPRPNTD